MTQASHEHTGQWPSVEELLRTEGTMGATLVPERLLTKTAALLAEPAIGDRVEVAWVDITEHHDVHDGDDKDTGATECVSWGILLVDNDDVLKIIRERRGDTKDVQAFPRGCVKRVTVLEPRGISGGYGYTWTVTGEGDDTTQTDE